MKLLQINSRKVIAGVAILLTIGLMFTIFYGLYKRNLRQIEEIYIAQIHQVELSKDSLQVHSDSVDLVLAQYELKNDSLGKVILWYKVDRDRLQDELKEALNDMWDHYLNDNGLYAYDYLQGRYLSKDTLEYLFSGDQVTYMATDIIRGDYLDSLLNIESARSLSLTNQVTNYKEMVGTLKTDRDKLEYITDDLYKQIAARIEESRLTKEENAILTKALRKWKAGSIGAGIGLVALLILL